MFEIIFPNVMFLAYKAKLRLHRHSAYTCYLSVSVTKRLRGSNLREGILMIKVPGVSPTVLRSARVQAVVMPGQQKFMGEAAHKAPLRCCS